MTTRLRLLLDTNILIPLQDSMLALEPSLGNFVRLAGIGGHYLLYHPASVVDIQRDKDIERRNRTLARLSQYTSLTDVPKNPENSDKTFPNDACDNDILYALQCSAVHALVTEDKEIHAKGRRIGISDQIYTIQTAEDWLKRLHQPNEVQLPNIDDIPLYTLTNQLNNNLFDSLRASYDTPTRSFNTWFREKAKTGRKAWIARNDEGTLDAICIYTMQIDESINETKEILRGRALKLCTFKVGDRIRGRKIGELFLKAAFRYATTNQCENIFTHTNPDQTYLLALLNDFGFKQRGFYQSDIVLVKAHPSAPPSIDADPLKYATLYFPHYRKDASVQKFIVPIKPQYHSILFPDLVAQRQLFEENPSLGNAIKLAYLCQSPSNQVQAGDIVLFYRSQDQKSVTSIGIVERYETHSEAAKVMQLVGRRTVYSQTDINLMTTKPVRVMLFRLLSHLKRLVSLEELRNDAHVPSKIMSITKISNESFLRILNLGQG